MNGILGRKLGMTQIFLDSGERVPVTVLEAGPCEIVQVKTAEQDGYSAFKIGFDDAKESRLNKPNLGQFAKSGVSPKKYLVEVSAENPEEWSVGTKYDLSIFDGTETVNVMGVSKGHGFAGTIKRHGFAKGPRTHGSHNVRAPGSIGACSYPGKTFPGMRGPGQYGNKRVTVRNLKIVKRDDERNLIFLKGAVPGPKEGLILIKKS